MDRIIREEKQNKTFGIAEGELKAREEFVASAARLATQAFGLTLPQHIPVTVSVPAPPPNTEKKAQPPKECFKLRAKIKAD